MTTEAQLAQLRKELATEMIYHKRKAIVNKIVELVKASKKASTEQPELPLS